MRCSACRARAGVNGRCNGVMPVVDFWGGMISDTTPPRLGYTRGAYCTWVIPAVPGYIVSLAWGQFSLYYGGTQTAQGPSKVDSLTILAIDSSSAVQFPSRCSDFFGNLMPGCGTYCNASLNGNDLCAALGTCLCARDARDWASKHAHPQFRIPRERHCHRRVPAPQWLLSRNILRE